jgi:hypothetical protein
MSNDHAAKNDEKRVRLRWNNLQGSILTTLRGEVSLGAEIPLARCLRRGASAIDSENRITKECAMKLTSAQVERTLSQFEAQAIPDNHPVIPQLTNLFGDHTFFLNDNGLNIVEPAPEVPQAARVVNLANWSDENLTKLAPHEPEPTDAIIEFESKH